MILTLIAGVVTGYIVSIPPLGPIAFALISKGFKNEIKEGLAISIGAAFMDFVYCMIAFGGISLLISLLPESVGRLYSMNAGAIQIVLIYSGCMIVIVYGIIIMRSKASFNELGMQQSQRISELHEKAVELQERAVELTRINVPVVAKSSLGGLFIMGILLCMSSLTLPASWIALVGYLKSYRVINASFAGGVLFSAGAALGTTFWFYTLLKLITGNKHRINPQTISKLNIIAGIILILLGIFLFVKASITIFNLSYLIIS
ncbi:MAG: LysE family transporter [Ignavibacteria bacterium]|jgi:threonine/homoserine/homoserine lactone efflux protein